MIVLRVVSIGVRPHLVQRQMPSNNRPRTRAAKWSIIGQPKATRNPNRNTEKIPNPGKEKAMTYGSYEGISFENKGVIGLS